MNTIPDGDPLEVARRIDEICQAFENAWLTGEAPDLKRHVDMISTDARGGLLAELLRLELHYRFQAGHAINPAAYMAQFPEFEGVVRQAFSVRKRSRP